MAITMRDIAKMAGVSNAAVSRYLNGGPVGEEKRERIRAAIQATGYQPSAKARSLRSGKSYLVGVVVPKINSESVSRVTAGIGQVLREGGYQMILADAENDPEVELDYLALFENYPVDGIILVGTVITLRHRQFFENATVPVVVVGQHVDEVSCVYHDDRGAASDLGRALAERYPEGRFAYMGVRTDDRAVGAARLQGFKAGLASLGLALDDALVKSTDFSCAGGAEATREVLEEDASVRVIACATDTIAAGAIEAVHERFDVEPGEGYAPLVTGFGDNQLLQAVTGGIPTVHFAYRTSGNRGAQALIALMDDTNAVPMQIQLGYRLVGIN